MVGRQVAVLDVGKTSARVSLVAEDGNVVAVRRRACRSLPADLRGLREHRDAWRALAEAAPSGEEVV